MIADIFICSYCPDVRFLEYCLRSIKKYAIGFRQTVVVYHEDETACMKPVCDKFDFVKQKTFAGPNDHLKQNEIKTSADLFSDAEYFLMLDSDCLATEKFRPEDYMTNGLPDLVYAPYYSLQDVPGGVPWRGITENAVGFSVEFEFMRRFPFYLPSWIFSTTRKRIESVHKTSFGNYVRTAPKLGQAFHGYSEYNAIGAVAFTLFRGCFHCYLVSDGLKPGKVKQFWSHSGRSEVGVDGPAPREIEELEKIVA